jgi:hypothetical protein
LITADLGGLCALDGHDIDVTLKQLGGFESMTWDEVLSASGGRGQKGGNNHHAIAYDGLTKQAKIRLAEIKMDDIEEVFSLRFSGKLRLYGIRSLRVCRLLWIDPWHGDNAKAVVPCGLPQWERQQMR